MVTKLCKQCNTKKPATTKFFGKHNSTKDGFRNECKECRNQKLVHHWNEDKTKLRCTKCSEYKNPTEFDVNSDKPHRDCKDTRCKKCKAKAANNRRTQRSRTDQFHRVFVERFQGMRDRAKVHDIPMELSIEDLKKLYEKQEHKCAISGIEMTTILGKGRIPTNISIDQINPGKGYTAENTQLVCMAVNQMKSDLTIEELLVFCKAILENS